MLNAADRGCQYEPPSPSRHPAAVKARRWRKRKRQESAGYVFATVAVSPCQVRALRRLGLVAGDPDRWQEPRPPPLALGRALQRLLEAAGPLAKVAEALQPRGGEVDDEG